MESLGQRSKYLSYVLGFRNGFLEIERRVHYILQLGIELIKRLILFLLNLFEAYSEPP